MLVAFTVTCFVSAWAIVALSPPQTEEDRKDIEDSDPWFNNED